MKRGEIWILRQRRGAWHNIINLRSFNRKEEFHHKGTQRRMGKDHRTTRLIPIIPLPLSFLRVLCGEILLVGKNKKKPSVTKYQKN
jgi:hypothetical protein